MTAKRSAVNSKTVHLLEAPAAPFLLVVNKGEDLFAALLNCAQKAKLASASFSGFGAVKNVEMGFFNKATRQYQNKFFSTEHELIAMHGTITKFAGEYFIHLHAAISDSNYQVNAGHIHRAEVAVVVEITVIPFAAPIERQPDPATGLKLIQVNYSC